MTALPRLARCAPALAVLACGWAACAQVAGPPPPELWHPRVYFGPGSAALSAQADTELRKVAAVLQSFRGKVHLSANADTSGEPAANLSLSIRRGQAAADRLIALGVAPSTLQIDAHGEARRAVATGDDAPEALNRVVHIDWRD